MRLALLIVRRSHCRPSTFPECQQRSIRLSSHKRILCVSCRATASAVWQQCWEAFLVPMPVPNKPPPYNSPAWTAQQSTAEAAHIPCIPTPEPSLLLVTGPDPKTWIPAHIQVLCCVQGWKGPLTAAVTSGSLSATGDLLAQLLLSGVSHSLLYRQGQKILGRRAH